MPLLAMDTITFQFLDVNEAALKQYGYTKKEFLKLTGKDIRPQDDIDKFITQTHLHLRQRKFKKEASGDI